MSQAVSRRGKPVIALVAVLAAWVLTRAMLWESPFPQLPEVSPLFASNETNAAPRVAMPSRPDPDPGSIVGHLYAPDQVGWSFATSLPPSAGQSFHDDRILPPEPTEFVAGHQLLYLSALGRVPIPAKVAHLMRQSANGPANPPPFPSRTRRDLDRWSLDGWAFVRPGGSAEANGPFPATYGASQAGAVLRYRFDPESKRRFAAYLRVTAALNGLPDREAALGVSARPIARLPLSTLAELRLRKTSNGTEIRPAALAVSEFAPFELPLDTRAEFYVQGGYVGGEFATGFADGQFKVTREIGDFDLGKMRVGAGTWGGAQSGAARLDVGPTASFDVRIGETPAQLAVDYRLRVAGDAEPGSGVAVTLSTGF